MGLGYYAPPRTTNKTKTTTTKTKPQCEVWCGPYSSSLSSFTKRVGGKKKINKIMKELEGVTERGGEGEGEGEGGGGGGWWERDLSCWRVVFGICQILLL